MSSKFHLSKWKTYFPQFIDKLLKIEEVKYLIYYVKFYVPSVFPTSLDVSVRLCIISPSLHRE